MLYVLLSTACYMIQNVANKEVGRRFPGRIAGIALSNALVLFFVTVIAAAVGGAKAMSGGLMALAGLFGLLYMTTIVLIVASFASGPLGPSALIINMSMMGSVVLGVLVWGERVSAASWVGVACMAMVIVLSSVGDRKADAPAGRKRWLLLTFGALLSNVALVAVKKSQSFAFPLADPIAFSFWGFLFADACCWALAGYFWIRGERYAEWRAKPKTLLTLAAATSVGTAGGNLLQMVALQTVPSMLLFPITEGLLTAGVWVLSVTLYRERVRATGVAALALAVAGIVLMNL